MNARRIRTALVVMLGTLGAASMACETLVQLDRNAVDAGEETACAICSDATDEGDDSSADGKVVETGPDAGDGSTYGASMESGDGG